MVRANVLREYALTAQEIADAMVLIDASISEEASRLTGHINRTIQRVDIMDQVDRILDEIRGCVDSDRLMELDSKFDSLMQRYIREDRKELI